MGVDVVTYRIRVGRFSSRSKKKTRQLAPNQFNISGLAVFDHFKLLAVLTVLFLLLSSAGNVELNPGPTNAEKLDDLQRSIDSLIESNDQNQRENVSKLNEIHKGIADLGIRVSSLEVRVSEIGQIKENLATVTKTLDIVERESASAHDQISELRNSLDDMNGQMRRNNLIFGGLPERENETWNDTEVVVSNFIKEKLTPNHGEIERAHRLGPKRLGSNRLIIVRFLSFKDKDNVLRNAPKLKNVSPRVWISEDFSPKVRFERKKLLDFSARFRDQHTRYKLSFDKLHVGNETYMYDHATQSVTPVQRPPEVVRADD